MSNEDARWKTKYFDSLDEFEQQEKTLKKQVHLLQRLAVRVSLAADGVEATLDGELGKVRTLLRGDALETSELESQLNRIEKTVLSLDEDRKTTADGVSSALSELVEQLIDLEISGSHRKTLKKYAKSLQKRSKLLQEYPLLLTEYSELHAKAIEEALNKSETEQKGGFLSKLLKGQSEIEEQAAPEQARNEEETGDVVQNFSLDAEKPDYASNEQPTGKAVPYLESDEISAYSKVAQNVWTKLAQLFDQLSLPPSRLQKAQQLKDKLESGVTWPEVVPTLDDIINLVTAAVIKGQNDFEAYLRSLDDSLTLLHGFLNTNKENEIRSSTNNNLLDKAVREHVASMQSSVNKEGDDSELKSSIQKNLDSIIDSMNQFLVNESNREDQIKQEMEQLQNKLKEMEKEKEVIQEQLKQERTNALTDVLTGLANRESYYFRVEQEYDRWRRYRNPLTLAVGDIDLFKRVNDEFGHLAGDKVIQIIGREIAQRIRRTDFVARYGGEEFVILLPETVKSTAAEVINKTREMIGKLPFHFRNQRVQITMSFGVCEFQDEETIESVFEKADKALYKAKEQGRNQVVTAKDQR